MLNNGKADGRPLFLTAFHCAGTGDHSNDMVLFNFQRNECDDSSALPDTKQVAHGRFEVECCFSVA